MKFVSELTPAGLAIVAKCWRDYKVAESPVTVKLLASSFLRKRTSCDAKNWEAWLTPAPEKYFWWLSRVTEAFAARVARANAEMQGKQVTLRTKAAAFRDKTESAEVVFQVSMAWAAWQPEMKTMVSEQTMTELNAMFARGHAPQRKQSKYGAGQC